MKALKAIGRFAVYILFFGATWVLNLLIVALFSVFFGDNAGEVVSDLEILCFLIIPVTASLIKPYSRAVARFILKIIREIVKSFAQ